MKHTLAIRYCGGCRTAFDRAEVVQAILQGLLAKGLDVQPEYDEDVPVGILVCGCMTQCLLRDELIPPTWHYIGPDGLFDNTPLCLEAVVNSLYNELAGMPKSR